MLTRSISSGDKVSKLPLSLILAAKLIYECIAPRNYLVVLSLTALLVCTKNLHPHIMMMKPAKE